MLSCSMLSSCTSIIDSGSSGFPVVETPSSFRDMHERGGGAENQIMTSTAVKQFKELRSLCLKIISWVLNKYDDHEFGCEFWNLFFDSVKPLVNGFKQECASSAKPSSLFSCFLSMSGSYKLVWLLHREKSIVSDIFSILTVPTASEAILSCVLKFVENLLNLDSDLDHEDNPVKRTLLPNLDALICGLHCLFLCNKVAKRKLVKCPGERELSIFRLLSKYIKDLSSASKFVDIMLVLLTKGVQDCGVCVEALNVIRQMIPVVGSESTTKILNAVSPLLASVSLDVRMSVCDLLDALAGTDSSLVTGVLGLLVEVTGEDLKEEYINHVLPVMRSIFQSAVDVLKNRQLGVSAEATDCSWKGAYYSLILFEKILHQFHGLCLAGHLEDMWETTCELLLHPHVWLRGVLNCLVAFYFASVDQADGVNHEKSLGTFFLMTPSRLFLVAVSLCCQLKALLIDDAASTLITQNLASTICALHSFFVPNKSVGGDSIWSTLEHHEQSHFLEAFQVLDSLKGRSMFASLTSGYDNQIAEENGNRHSLLIYYLLKRMGKIALQMEAVQMKIVFNVFELISPKIINPVSSQIGDVQGYAYQLLLPLYKVCEGYAGKVISDDVKQLAQEALECIRDTLGMNNFAPIYTSIRKNLKEKRDRWKQREKLMRWSTPCEMPKGSEGLQIRIEPTRNEK